MSTTLGRRVWNGVKRRHGAAGQAPRPTRRRSGRAAPAAGRGRRRRPWPWPPRCAPHRRRAIMASARRAPRSARWSSAIRASSRQVVEQGLQPRRRTAAASAPCPARRAPSLIGRVERIVAGRAEQVRDSRCGTGRWSRRPAGPRDTGRQRHLVAAAGRALGLGVEGADRFQRVAEQVEADRLLGARREDVDHAAADGELAALGDGRGAHVAVDGEIALQRRLISSVAARRRRRSRRPWSPRAAARAAWRRRRW